MNKFLRIVLALLLLGQYAGAQTEPPLHLAGEELKTWLRTNWYDGKRQVLDYSTARGKMYNYIDNYNDKVTCVYSGYQESMPYSETGTSTSVGIINCEHTVPQSWFDEAVRMRSDIHHLFPTHTTWNADRGSDPFAEIPDNQTTKWMRGSTSQSSIPTSDIEEYSEDTNSQFEPREDHKGNLARAVFYFYTMHAGQRFDAGKEIISAVADINTLYQWHLQDPVDAREIERNNRIEVAQGNRNPYIDYPELVARAWGLTPVNCDPATQVSNLAVSEITPTTFKVSWAKGSGDGRMVVVRESEAVSFTPSGSYTGINSNFSLAADQENGHRIVYSGSGDSVVVRGVSANKTYYVQVFELCSSDVEYNTTGAPAISVTTSDYACAGTPAAVSGLKAASITHTGFNLTWTNGSGDGRIVVIKKDEAPEFIPQSGTAYTGASANIATATTLSDGSILIYNGSSSEVAVTGLQAGNLYFVQVFESCSNGNQYAATAPALAITTTAANNPPTGNGSILALQDFNGTANDGWAVTSGFSSSIENTGYPAGQRIKTGASLQVAGVTQTVEFSEVNVAGKQDVYFELYNSSVATTSGNGFDGGDYLEVYIAMDGAAYSDTPDIRLTGSTTDNNIRYGMNGTATIVTAAGTAVEKVFTDKGDFAADKAPSILRVTIPDGSSTVKAKLILNNNNAKEVWNVEDVALYAAVSSADCDENPLEGIAGADKTICAGTETTLGAAAEAGYTYTWTTTIGLSDATVANPSVTLTVPGIYTYQVAATNGTCTYEDEVTVTVTAAPAQPAITQHATQLTASIAGASYQWYKGEELVGNEITQSITITESGEYRVRVQNEEGCYSDFSEALQVTLQPTAVADDAAAVGIVVSPNPTTGKVILYTQQPLKQVQVTVISPVGKVVYSQALNSFTGQQALDVSRLPAGLYLLHITADKLQAVQRLVVAK